MGGTFGMIHTKSILTEPKLNFNIKNAGRKALNYLIRDPTLYNFMKASQNFVQDTNILNILKLTQVKELLDDLNKLGIIGASMNQLGRSVFAFCNNTTKNAVEEVLQSYEPDLKTFHSTIYESQSIYLERQL
jgi:pantoate kinase